MTIYGLKKHNLSEMILNPRVFPKNYGLFLLGSVIMFSVNIGLILILSVIYDRG